MSFGAIVTQGQGIEALEAYFELLHNTLPSKLPRDVSSWVNTASYDAPHGILTVWKGGYWEVTFALASVIADIQTIPGLVVNVV